VSVLQYSVVLSVNYLFQEEEHYFHFSGTQVRHRGRGRGEYSSQFSGLTPLGLLLVWFTQEQYRTHDTKLKFLVPSFHSNMCATVICWCWWQTFLTSETLRKAAQQCFNICPFYLLCTELWAHFSRNIHI
jgi:hypothetical protein